MTGAEALRAAVARLTEAGIEGAPRDARRLLAHALGEAPDRVTLVLPEPMTEAALARFEAAVTARTAHQPVAQITGLRHFFGRDFRVTPDTLDPRPETEALILTALDQPFSRVLDLGTGTGCILLTLLAERPGATGLGTDLSPEALAVAQSNAAALGLTDRADLIQTDWCHGLAGSFDLIVSNPPYIAQAEMPDLSPDVRNWEPEMALTDGGDGLGAYRAIAQGVGALMAPGARLLLEIGPSQAQAVSEILKSNQLTIENVVKDIDSRDRVVVANSTTI